MQFYNFNFDKKIMINRPFIKIKLSFSIITPKIDTRDVDIVVYADSYINISGITLNDL
jgi:hypothetical protein